MAVDNSGPIDATQASVVLLKFEKEPFENVPAEKIIELLNSKKLKLGGEPPISGFTEIKHSQIGSRQEILVEYLIESPVPQRLVKIKDDGSLDWTQQVIHVPKLLTAHIRLNTGIIELYTSDKRFTNRLVSDIRDCLRPIVDLSVEKVVFSEKVLEHIMSKNEELLRVKFDHLDHTYIKEIILKGDLIDASEEFKHFRTQKNGKFGEFHIKFYTGTGELVSMVVSRGGSLRFFRTTTELTWDLIEEIIDELEKEL